MAGGFGSEPVAGLNWNDWWVWIGNGGVLALEYAVAQTVPRNGILLHGEPGNGKTVFAEALAGELGVPLLEVTYGPIASKWIGEVPALLTRTFELARNSAPCVLFIDEIDSFIKSRDSATSNAEAPIITNVILTELVKLRSSRVVVIGATNYLELLDAAAIREGRFDYKVEVTAPDEQARIGLLKEGVRRHASHVPVNEEQLIAVAQRWNGFSAARLNAVCQAVDDVAKKTKFKQFGHAEWMLALREVQGRRGRLPANTKSLGEMLFTEATKSALDLIASRLKNVAQIEARGGSLPGGILFYGPPGTGKTAAARALAKEAGWAFLAVAGPDLIADRGRLAKTFAEAKDLRPTIVFIDEADDILRDRQFSQHSDMVNKLLTIMDGAEDKIKDLVWIAATNHPENVDPALLRAGRFSEKVLFSTPPTNALPNHITDWMRVRKVALGGRLNVAVVAAKLGGQTIANVDGALQYALNAAIHRGDFDGETVLVEADLDQAIRVVIGQTDFV
jgi:transitional endoplasmic reticulum ATPase